MRIDETLQRIDGKLVFVPPKTERARREVPLPAFAVERLRAHRLHDLRHGVLTALAKNGTPAYVTSKIAGHSSVHFTANTYTHADEESVGRALAGLEAAFGG